MDPDLILIIQVIQVVIILIIIIKTSHQKYKKRQNKLYLKSNLKKINNNLIGILIKISLKNSIFNKLNRRVKNNKLKKLKKNKKKWLTFWI